MLISSDPCGGLQQPPVHPRDRMPSVAALDVIDVGQHETAVEQLERVLQVLRNSGTAEPSCQESFMALAEHVSVSPGAGHRPVDLERRPAQVGTVQLRRRLGTRRISPKVPTAACSNVIIARREARNVRISFQLSMTIKLDPPGEQAGSPCE